MHLQNHFQNAYVTHDIDKAIALMESRYGVQGLVPFDLELDVITPAGENKLCMRLAYAWAGRTQVELIQPRSGWVQHYVDSLPQDESDYRPHFNHVAMRRDDMDAMQVEVDSLKLPILMEGNLNGLRFVYVDARNELGHLLEYVWTTPDFWQLLGWPS